MITVYGRPDCVQCHYTCRWLEKLGHEFLYVDVDIDTEAQTTIAAMNLSHLPIVVTPTERWAGFKLDKIRNL